MAGTLDVACSVGCSVAGIVGISVKGIVVGISVTVAARVGSGVEEDCAELALKPFPIDSTVASRLAPCPSRIDAITRA